MLSHLNNCNLSSTELMFLRVHLSVSILAAFILADVLAVLQVLWYYSLFYDRRSAIVSRPKKLFYYIVVSSCCQAVF